MAVAFSSSDENVISRMVPVKLAFTLSQPDISKEFHLISLIDWIETHNFTRVALQFPDELLAISAEVAQYLDEKTSAEIVILADTSYGSCCVDEMAAEHYCASAIVHFGHACLSPTPGKLPVRYEFGQRCCELDLTGCVSNVVQLFADRTEPAVLLYDTIFHHVVCDVLAPALSRQLPNLIVPSLVLPNEDGSVHQQQDDNIDSLVHFGRKFRLHPGRSISDYTIVYLGDPESPFLTAFLMNFSTCRSLCYDIQSASCIANAWNSNRALAKRYYLVECARDARRVGILMGTLGVADYLVIAARLETVIHRAGKAVYRFVVGKLNTAKLANFAEIDVFVLIACPENSLVDSKQFYRPVVTPFEMEMACCPDRQWTGNYETDFRQLLPGGLRHCDEQRIDSVIEVRTDLSLITGKLRQVGVEEEDSDLVKCAADSPSGALVRRNEQITVANNSAGFFGERSWKGLDPQLGKTPVQLAVDGAKGIAMSYEHEPNPTT